MITLCLLLLLQSFAQEKCNNCANSNAPLSTQDQLVEINNKMPKCADFKIIYNQMSNTTKSMFDTKDLQNIQNKISEFESSSVYKNCKSPGFKTLFFSDCDSAVTKINEIISFREWPYEVKFRSLQEKEFEAKTIANYCEDKVKKQYLNNLNILWKEILNNYNQINMMVANYNRNSGYFNYGISKNEFAKQLLKTKAEINKLIKLHATH